MDVALTPMTQSSSDEVSYVQSMLVFLGPDMLEEKSCLWLGLSPLATLDAATQPHI